MLDVPSYRAAETTGLSSDICRETDETDRRDRSQRCANCGAPGIRTVALCCSNRDCGDMILDGTGASEELLQIEAAREHRCPHCGEVGVPTDMIQCTNCPDPKRTGDDAKVAFSTSTTAQILGEGGLEAPGIDIDIDEEFSNLIPPPSGEELVQLESSILAVRRCLDPVIVWVDGQKRILLDGHNRLKICRRHGLAYKVEAISLQDREAALQWILEHQLGRRNLTPEAYGYLRGKLYNGMKSQGARRDLTSGQNVQKSTTAQDLAAHYKVDEKTIRRDGHFAAQLDQLAEEGGADIKNAVLARDAKLTRTDVARLLKWEAPTRKHILTQVLAGGVAAKLIKNAMRATSAGGDTQKKTRTVQGAASSPKKQGDRTKVTKSSPSTAGSPSAAKPRATGRQDDDAAKHLDQDPVDTILSALDVAINALNRLPRGPIKADRLLVMKGLLRQLNRSLKARD